jgi:hypothetical protein
VSKGAGVDGRYSHAVWSRVAQAVAAQGELIVERERRGCISTAAAPTTLSTPTTTATPTIGEQANITSIQRLWEGGNHVVRSGCGPRSVRARQPRESSARLTLIPAHAATLICWLGLLLQWWLCCVRLLLQLQLKQVSVLQLREVSLVQLLE